MYEVRYLSDGYKEIYATEKEWNQRIDYIAEVSSYDINIENGSFVAVIDDGDPWYDEDYPDYD